MMNLATVRAAAVRIAEHVTDHQLNRVRLVLHGGEPLLVGPDGLRAMLTELRTILDPLTDVEMRIQSNGILLTESFCDLFLEFGVGVGISLDGYREANDRHRRHQDGAGSYGEVVRALELLRRPAYRRAYAGILCTVDVANDPIAVYEALVAQQPPRLDFLLPHATWDRPPWRVGTDPTPYATWLLRIHRRWEDEGRPVPIRLFDSVRAAFAGRPTSTEALGGGAADLAVVETDGSWEQVDSVKVAYHGATATGLTVFSDSVDRVAAHPAIARRQLGVAGLCETCQSCAVVRVCGGGLYAHRYRTGTGFDNPSVYCADLKELIVAMGDAPAGSGRPAPEQPEDPELAAAAGLSGTAFDELAAGEGGTAALGQLKSQQDVIVRALVAAAAAELTDASAATDAWAVLAELHREAPDAVADVFGHPYVRSWAVGVLSGSIRDPEHLSRIAAAAAVRSGRSMEVAVPVTDGRVQLPALGTLRIDVSASGVAQLTTGPETNTVRFGGTVHKVTLDPFAPADRWRPVQRVVLDSWTTLLDDDDPYRDVFGFPVEGWLSRTASDAWLRSLSGAWRMLSGDAPEQAAGIQTVLRVVTPLQMDQAGKLRSAAARHAFGAVGVAQASPNVLSVLLIHEYQHNKLAALLDLCDMFDRNDPVRIAVAWRPDRRPLEGALHGAYAHLGMAALWRTRTAVPWAGQARAGELFRLYRDWTQDAVEKIKDTGALLPIGERFITGMQHTLTQWRDL